MVSYDRLRALETRGQLGERYFRARRLSRHMRTSFSIPDDVVAAFDEVWQDEGIENRSRAVREAMLEYVETHSRLEDTAGEIVALIGFDYQFHDVIDDLHSIQHDFQGVIQTTNHVHLGDWCLETLFCRGPATQVRELTYQLRDFDSVRRVKVMIIQEPIADA
jgi:CopG family nickel-responsive transcriptional regulator